MSKGIALLSELKSSAEPNLSLLKTNNEGIGATSFVLRDETVTCIIPHFL